MCNRILCICLLQNLQQIGFKDLPWKTHLLGFVQYLYWATAEKINISFQGIWTEVMSWETHMHICPPKLDISWKRTLSLCCQQKVKRCSESGMLIFFSCYLCCKYLFEREMTHWIMRSLSVRSIWPGQSLHFSQKMCICWRNVFLDSSSFFK